MNLKRPLVVGQTVTLRIKHWFHPAGATGIVLRMRRDRNCVSGLRVWVTMNDCKVRDLDSRWFAEVSENYSEKGQP